MFQYADGNGNSFILESGEVPSLHVETVAVLTGAGGGTSVAQAPQRRELTYNVYMELVAAFQVAIDNKLQHSELMKKGTGMIIRVEDGLQRRYMLCENCAERRDLEALLWNCMR